jgi:hypothetical protein
MRRVADTFSLVWIIMQTTSARISRRRFLAAAGALSVASTSLNFVSHGLAEDTSTPSQRDAYGGCTRFSFESTGYFRLQKTDRWWLVTPDGHAFLSWGLNHMAPGELRRPYNREHWQQTFGLPEGCANRDWMEPYLVKARADLDAFGFNTLGCHTSIDGYPEIPRPYVHRIDFADIPHYEALTEESFHDVFARAFADHCDELAKREVLPHAEDPLLIAYTFCDCPVFTEHEAADREVQIFGAPRAATPTWPRVLRNLGPDAPGKQAYVRLMHRVYSGYIDEFNRVYRTVFASFDDLLQARNWRPAADPRNFAETRDNRLFLEAIVDRYYATAIEAVRRHDPCHMIFGDKINGNTNPPDWLMRIVGRHVDLIFYQCYGYYGEQEAAMDRWSALTLQSDSR